MRKWLTYYREIGSKDGRAPSVMREYQIRRTRAGWKWRLVITQNERKTALGETDISHDAGQRMARVAEGFKVHEVNL